MMETFDKVYGVHDGREMHVDIYRPSGSVNHRTALLLFHGGGFRVGDRKMLQPQCIALAERGFTAIAVEYRLIDDANVIWPAPLYDAQGAISWAAAHADEIDVDPDRIILQGHSAGSLLSLMAVGTVGKSEFHPPFELQAPEARVAAVIAYYPLVQLALREVPALPSDGPPSPEAIAEMIKALRADDGTVPASMVLGPTATEAQAAAASPLNYVSDAFPPTLILHGTADMVVAPAASTRLFEALEAAGVVAELHLIAGVTHGFDATPSLFRPCAALTESFLSRFIIDPSGFAEEETAHNPLAAIARARP
jgi:acetyl esterase/lipase